LEFAGDCPCRVRRGESPGQSELRGSESVRRGEVRWAPRWRAGIGFRRSGELGFAAVCIRLENGGARPSAATCESEDMTKTGESPSPVETWNDRVPEGHCVAARRGGEPPEGSSQAQNSLPRRLNPIRRAEMERVCVAKTKLGARASCQADTEHVSEPTWSPPTVPGVSMRIRPRHGLRNEARAGARRERYGTQSRHSSEGARESRVSEGR